MGLSTLLYRLLTLAAVLVLANGLVLTKRQINCRIYVFAPVCRGVAAKRALQESPSFDDAIPSSNMDDYVLNEAPNSASTRGDRAQLESLFQTLLGGAPRPRPAAHRHKHRAMDGGLVRFLLSHYTGDDSATE